jgi:hypothetical protein
LAASNACGRNAIPLLRTLQLARKRDSKPDARGGQRMTNGNSNREYAIKI